MIGEANDPLLELTAPIGDKMKGIIKAVGVVDQAAFSCFFKTNSGITQTEYKE